MTTKQLASLMLCPFQRDLSTGWDSSFLPGFLSRASGEFARHGKSHKALCLIEGFTTTSLFAARRKRSTAFPFITKKSDDFCKRIRKQGQSTSCSIFSSRLDGLYWPQYDSTISPDCRSRCSNSHG